MRNLIIFGASHAKRLATAARLNKEISNNFNILEFAVPGKRYRDLIFPSVNINPNDILVTCCFGNDLFPRQFVRFEKLGNKKIIHMTKYSPNNEDDIKNDFVNLRKIVEKINAKVFVIDSPYRHLCCCKKHKDSRMAKFQARQNRVLQQVFQETKNVKVLDHRKLLGVKQRIWNKNPAYEKLLIDSVHFHSRIYQSIISNVIKMSS